MPFSSPVRARTSAIFFLMLRARGVRLLFPFRARAFDPMRNDAT
jgi:hypothetical protein